MTYRELIENVLIYCPEATEQQIVMLFNQGANALALDVAQQIELDLIDAQSASHVGTDKLVLPADLNAIVSVRINGSTGIPMSYDYYAKQDFTYDLYYKYAIRERYMYLNFDIASDTTVVIDYIRNSVLRADGYPVNNPITISDPSDLAKEFLLDMKYRDLMRTYILKELGFIMGRADLVQKFENEFERLRINVRKADSIPWTQPLGDL